MSVEIRVPPLGESVVEATVGRWAIEEGEAVSRDQVLVELETDKITVEVAAQQDGVLARIEKQEGATVGVNELLGLLESSDGKSERQAAPPAQEPESAAPPVAVAAEAEPRTSPAARAIAAEHDVDIRSVRGSGPNARITKEDVVQAVDAGKEKRKPITEAAPAEPEPAQRPTQAASAPAKPADAPVRDGREKRERMSRRRQTIARRLVEAQRTTASLTTFNEVDLSRVMELRKRRQDEFVKRHGVKVGFMSFFTKAIIGALKQFPRLNAEIDGDEIVLKRFYDIGIAVGAEEGLVVPVIRDADRMGFAELEKTIGELGNRARDGKLTLDELQGGTFTITNGGVFGSMLSTPILNPPQVGILGMHNIVERAVVINGEITIRPMMYLALTYDHRIVDGSEAVRFLVAVKRMIEDPENLLLEG